MKNFLSKINSQFSFKKNKWYLIIGGLLLINSFLIIVLMQPIQDSAAEILKKSFLTENTYKQRRTEVNLVLNNPTSDNCNSCEGLVCQTKGTKIETSFVINNNSQKEKLNLSFKINASGKSLPINLNFEGDFRKIKEDSYFRFQNSSFIGTFVQMIAGEKVEDRWFIFPNKETLDKNISNNLLLTFKENPPFQLKNILSKERYNGEVAYHYEVGINKDNLLVTLDSFFDQLSSQIKTNSFSSFIKSYRGKIEKEVSLILEAHPDLKAEVWISKKDYSLLGIKFGDSNELIDVGVADRPFFILYNQKNNREASFTITKPQSPQNWREFLGLGTLNQNNLFNN